MTTDMFIGILFLFCFVGIIFWINEAYSDEEYEDEPEEPRYVTIKRRGEWIDEEIDD